MTAPPVTYGAHPWRRWIDTFLESPHDITEAEHAPSVPGSSYSAGLRSMVMLFEGLDPTRRS